MSLTNPKTVVTEERLAEFYQQILPYLGGMPEILANKFSKSDLYSTDEKMIGQWIDGKPLYQKVFTVDHTAISNNTTCTIVDLSTLSIDKLIRFVPLTRWAYEPYSQTGGGTISTCYWHDTGDNTIKIKTSAVAWFGTDFYMLVQYTKTTDSPVAIGIDTDYSTEEKIVGTWIDGKPLYQKTVVITDTALSATTEVNHNIANVSKIIDYKAVMISSSSNSFVVPNFINTSSIAIGIEAVNATRIKFHTLGYTASEYESINATIQYTKTTD